VDDKFLTKRLAIKNGIKVLQLYGVINYHRQIPDVLKIAGVQQQFVVKAVYGLCGCNKQEQYGCDRCCWFHGVSLSFLKNRLKAI